MFPDECQVSSYAEPGHRLSGALVSVAWNTAGLVKLLPDPAVNVPARPSWPT